MSAAIQPIGAAVGRRSCFGIRSAACGLGTWPQSAVGAARTSGSQSRTWSTMCGRTVATEPCSGTRMATGKRCALSAIDSRRGTNRTSGSVGGGGGTQSLARLGLRPACGFACRGAFSEVRGLEGGGPRRIKRNQTNGRTGKWWKSPRRAPVSPSVPQHSAVLRRSPRPDGTD